MQDWKIYERFAAALTHEQFEYDQTVIPNAKLVGSTPEPLIDDKQISNIRNEIYPLLRFCVIKIQKNLSV